MCGVGLGFKKWTLVGIICYNVGAAANVVLRVETIFGWERKSEINVLKGVKLCKSGAVFVWSR